MADPPGSVTITGAQTESDCANAIWRDETGGIFSTAVSWPVYLVQADGVQLFRIPWGGVPHLRQLAGRAQSMGAFWYEQQRLFVGLPNGLAPHHASLVWNQPVPPPREWGEFKSANVWVEADHIRLTGLRLEFGLGAAVRVWNGTHLLVEDCEFTGCAYGVQAGAGVKPACHLQVERCWYNNTPQSDWARSWLTWNEVYSSYASSTLCSTGDRPVIIRDNLVTDFGDGVRVSPGVNPAQTGIAEVEGNWLAFGTDDAFELDGAGHHVVVRNNVVIDVHEGLSFSPLTDGPTTVTSNLFWNPVGGLNGSQLKFIPPDSFRGDAGRIRGIRVHDNVFCGEWLSWRGDVEVSDVELCDNLFSVDSQITPPWPHGLEDRDNIYRLPRDRTRTTATAFLTGMNDAGNSATTERTLQFSQQMLQSRPGPRWLKWDETPSTLKLMKLLGIQ
ncbi:MAG: hypothetical protein JSS49_01760 [Planctomycetes bacterium]|nr:hypothetical protein [Planctomycetota bacterium]